MPKKSPAKKKAAAKKKTAAKSRGGPKGRAVKRKPPVLKKKPPALIPGAKEVGRVIAFFRIPVVAVLKVARGSIKLGDPIWIKGHTTDLKLTVTSMQLNHQPIPEAKKGQEVGIKVPSRARRGDRVYLISG